MARPGVIDWIELGLLNLRLWYERRKRDRIPSDTREIALQASRLREAEAQARGDLDAVREERKYQRWLRGADL